MDRHKIVDPYAGSKFCAVRRCKILRRMPVQIFAPYAGAKFCAARRFKFLRRTPVQNFAPHASSKFCAVHRCKILRRKPAARRFKNLHRMPSAKFAPQPYRPCGATIAQSYETLAGESAAPVNAIRIWKQEQTNMPGCSASHCAAYVPQNPPTPY